jgi:hypothetical protein
MVGAHTDQEGVFGKDQMVFDMVTMGSHRPLMLVVGNRHF